MENDIINLIGMTCTGGALVVWAKETFGRDAEDIDGLDEEETEQDWKTYVPYQENHSNYKINI